MARHENTAPSAEMLIRLTLEGCSLIQGGRARQPGKEDEGRWIKAGRTG